MPPLLWTRRPELAHTSDHSRLCRGGEGLPAPLNWIRASAGLLRAG
ncbi:hypothetical protein FLM9_1047 [Candidatus Synechococcus spongiarum]|uniref:Uncharacterized protein n=1 Tax=Candidatus Synechococcus spongiarum TaxID=431041 RepID=A0A164Z5B9_9SYNE|nr:hypothetical protein FLM9_1047 [Candidatus Synechococcus spongiarum]